MSKAALGQTAQAATAGFAADKMPRGRSFQKSDTVVPQVPGWRAPLKKVSDIDQDRPCPLNLYATPGGIVRRVQQAAYAVGDSTKPRLARMPARQARLFLAKGGLRAGQPKLSSPKPDTQYTYRNYPALGKFAVLYQIYNRSLYSNPRCLSPVNP